MAKPMKYTQMTQNCDRSRVPTYKGLLKGGVSAEGQLAAQSMHAQIGKSAYIITTVIRGIECSNFYNIIYITIWHFIFQILNTAVFLQF